MKKKLIVQKFLEAKTKLISYFKIQLSAHRAAIRLTIHRACTVDLAVAVVVELIASW